MRLTSVVKSERIACYRFCCCCWSFGLRRPPLRFACKWNPKCTVLWLLLLPAGTVYSRACVLAVSLLAAWSIRLDTAARVLLVGCRTRGTRQSAPGPALGAGLGCVARGGLSPPPLSWSRNSVCVRSPSTCHWPASCPSGNSFRVQATGRLKLLKCRLLLFKVL